MIIKNCDQLDLLQKELISKKIPYPRPEKVLMVTPDFFDIDYAINVYMKNEEGKLNKINQNKAYRQWTQLKDTYQKLGFQVELIEGQASLCDMVFCANTSFPFLDEDNQKHVIASSMKSSQRRAEVDFMLDWYRNNNYKIHDPFELHEQEYFEANGDALIHNDLILWGYGFRTQIRSYEKISKLIQKPVIALELIDPYFYHLDTCLSILNSNTVAVVKEAFSNESYSLLAALYSNIIQVDYTEAKTTFAVNCHCPDDKNVLVPKGSTVFCKDLTKHGFKVFEVDTSEFIKSGGSIFCLKMMVY